MPAPQTQAFQPSAFQDDVPPADAFQNSAFQPQAFQFELSNVGAIPSAEAFGTPAVSRVIRNVGAIASLEAFGVYRLLRRIVTEAIASLEAFGKPTETGGTYGDGFDPSLIESREAFGIPIVSFVSSGQPTEAFQRDAFQTDAITQDVFGVGGISSGEAFGTARVSSVAPASEGGGPGGPPGGLVAPVAREGRQVVVTLVAGARQVVLFDKRV